MPRTGYGYSIPHRRIGAPPASVAFTPIVLTQTSVATTNPLQWDSDFTGYQSWDGVNTGDKHLMRWRRTNGGAWTTEVEQGLDDELLTGGFTWPLWEAAKPLATGYVEVQEQRARYAGGVEVLRSPWSNALVDSLAGIPFVPSSVSGIKDYYEVRAAKLWKDTAGTVAVTADGDAVARWDSELGTMAPFLQSTAGSRPIYRVNSGNEYLDFDGVNDFMAAGTTGITTLAQPYYIAVACKFNTIGGNHFIVDGSGSVNRALMQHNDLGSSPDYLEIYAGGFVGNQGIISTTNDMVFTGLFNGASSKPRRDGTDGTTINAGATAPIDGIHIASKYDGTANFMTGRIYGFVLVAASPSSGDKASLDTWLGALQGRSI